MGDRKEIIQTTRNQLITLKCKRLSDGRKPVYLLGMIKIEKRVGETEGWILIISGNPLIPHGIAGKFPNKIQIDKLRVTRDQKKAISESSLIPDGFVYLYIGNFFIGTSINLDLACQEVRLNILKLLSEYLNQYNVKVDLQRVVPFKEEFLAKIIMAKRGKHFTSQPGPSSPVEKRVKGVKFKFRNTYEQIFVDFECPANHSGYKVEVYFLQTFVCKPNVVDPYGRGRITRVLEHDKLIIPPSVMEATCSTSHGHHRSRRKSMEKRTINLRVLEVPGYENMRERRLLDEFKVARVDYWTIARLIKVKNDEWNGMTMAMLTERKVKPLERKHRQTGEGPSTAYAPPDGVLPSVVSTHHSESCMTSGRGTPAPAPVSSRPSSSQRGCPIGNSNQGINSPFNSNPFCNAPVKFVIMELELIASVNN